MMPQIHTHCQNQNFVTVTIENIREHMRDDPEIQAIVEALDSNQWIGSIKHLKAYANDFFIYDGILVRGNQIVLPECLRKQALINAHAAHSGIVVMKRSLRSRIWWPRLDKDVAEFVQKCIGCTAVARDDAPEPMIRTTLPHKPMDFVAIDHWSAAIIPEKILVITDY